MLKGTHCSEIQKQKMREAKLKNPIRYWLGKKRPEFSEAVRVKMGNAHKGLKETIITKERLSLAKLGEKNPMFGKFGTQHHNFIIDRSKLKTDSEHQYDTQYKYWMFKVRERDNWKCKINNIECSGRLETHHILPWSKFPELRYNINNGILLCRFHHPRKRKDEIKLAPIFQEIVLALA